MPATTEHQLEKLNDAHQAYLRATTTMAQIRATNLLLDRCLDAGMPMDEPSVTDWAAARVARWLVEA